MKKDELKIKRLRDGTYLLYNKYTNGHSHFRSRKAAISCRCLLRKGVMPNQPYFKSTAKRVLREEDYYRLKHKRKKDYYININKGVIR